MLPTDKLSGMKNGEKIAIGVTAIAAIGLIVLLTQKRRQKRIFTQLDRIAEEGYETAGDILYPLKHTRSRKNPYSYNDFSTN